MSPTRADIRVAITGGGLAGATCLRALLKHDHIDAHIFESAPAFKEAGQAIGMARNAYQALELMDLQHCLADAGAVTQSNATFMLAEGTEAGKVVDTIDATEGKRVTSIVHRAEFLRQLLAGVSPEKMHASKKLATVDRHPDESLTLHFQGGTTHDCDLLIGADGIHSTVRKILLGDDPAANPVPGGWFFLASLQPYEKLRSVLGEAYVNKDDPREYDWFGHGGFMMHNFLSDGNLVQFIACVATDSPDDSWMKSVPSAQMKGYFKGYPQHLQDALAVALEGEEEEEEEAKCICIWEHLPARTYADGPICVMGDAAHATSPWQGSGGGISIEDALVLSSLLGQITPGSPGDISTALQVYDDARRARTQRVVESSRGTGRLFTGRNPDYTLDVVGLRGRVASRWDFILDL
ncbi:Salicylate hydroxylase [Lecanosticta acicola]|uniref:Salicylate hydroxylase n=1 Tax=Lecanosticta acicola TaxID=111012 RepID=A0AAI8Z960_9PEZI|nr:Salicylate hydroxylase [Lecanosticta acicola]